MADQTFTGKVAADGTATITIRTHSMRTWKVTQISIELADAPSGAACNIRKNGYLVTPIIPTGDTAAGDPPVYIRPEDNVTIEWTGCTVNTIGKAQVFYDIV